MLVLLTIGVSRSLGTLVGKRLFLCPCQQRQRCWWPPNRIVTMSDGCVIERSMLLWAKATWMGGMADL